MPLAWVWGSGSEGLLPGGVPGALLRHARGAGRRVTRAKGPLGQRVAMGTAVRSGRGLEGLGKGPGSGSRLEGRV